MSRNYYVYILSSPSLELYIGVTNNLLRRLIEHRSGLNPNSWTHRHGATRLVYFESTYDVRAAIAREKKLKVWKRWRKLELIESSNPDWKDLLPPPRCHPERSEGAIVQLIPPSAFAQGDNHAPAPRSGGASSGACQVSGHRSCDRLARIALIV